jgi:hypothetical protein
VSTTSHIIGHATVIALDRVGRRHERRGHLDRAVRAYRRAATIATDTQQPARVIESFLERAALVEARAAND